MEHKDLAAYCGIYCGLCDHRTKIPERASALRAAMEQAEYDEWGPSLAGFDEFWSFLQKLTRVEDTRCCRSGTCGDGFCAIKKCARDKGVSLCVECADYPCQWVHRLGRGEPTLLHDGQRIREKGLEAWMEEQEERRAAGFCYGDIRCFPYEFPKLEEG